MKTVLHNHFIPHEGNDYQPHILQKTAVIFMAVLLLLSFTLANMQSLFWTNSDWLLGAVLPAVIVDLTNDNRDDGSLRSLARNAALDRAAQLKANHMAENSYFAHFAPDGTSPWFFFGQAGYSFVHAGENLAIHFVDSDDVVAAWMNSPTHRANILNGDFTEIGIGVAEGVYNGQKTIFVVQHFGAPQQVAAAPQPPAVVTEVTTQPAPSETVAAADITTESIADEPVTTPPSAPVLVPDPEPVVVTTPAAEAVPEPVETTIVPDPEPEIIEEVVVEEAVTAPAPDRLSELTTSTAPLAVGSTDTTVTLEPETTISSSAGFIGRLATSPNTLLQLLYVTLALFVIGSLLLSILIEMRRQQPVQIAYGVGLLVLTGGLLYVQTIITAGATIL